MGSHRAKRLRMECPICHHELDGDLYDHLVAGHTKDELAGQVRSYYEESEQGTFA